MGEVLPFNKLKTRFPSVIANQVPVCLLGIGSLTLGNDRFGPCRPVDITNSQNRRTLLFISSQVTSLIIETLTLIGLLNFINESLNSILIR